MEEEGLTQDALNNFRLYDTGELLIETAVKVAQLPIIEAHQVKQGGVQVADVMAIDDRFMAKLIGFAVSGPAFDAAASQEIRESFRIMVASPAAALGDGLTAKFAAPNHERFLEQATLLQIGQQSRNGLVDLRTMQAKVFLHPIVGIPVLLLMTAAMVDLDKTHTAFDQAARDQALASEMGPGRERAGARA